MWEHYLERHIRRSGRNQLVIGVVIIAAVVGPFAANQRYWHNFRYGPFPLRDADLAKIDDPLRQRRVWITLETRYRPHAIGTMTQDGQLVCHYHVVPLELGYRRIVAPAKPGRKPTTRPVTATELADVQAHLAKHRRPPDGFQPVLAKALLMSLDEEATEPGKFTGGLRDIPTHVRRSLQLDTEFPELLPAMLVVGNYRALGWLGAGVGGLVVVIGLWVAVLGLAVLGNPKRHDSWRQLAAYGDPAVLADVITTEMATDGSKLSIGGAVITSHWILRPRFYGVDAMPLDAVVWAYERVVQQGARGTKEFTAVLADRHGRVWLLSLKQGQAKQLLAQGQLRRPWILMGYSDELETAYQQARPAVVAAVDQRKADQRAV